MSSLTILWADDQAAVSETLASLLSHLNAEITHVSDGCAAFQKLQEQSFDLLIADLQMPPDVWGGLLLLEQIKKSGIEIPTIVLSGQGTQVETIKAMRLGAQDYVTKERAETELLPRIKELLDRESPSRRLLRLISQGESATFECKETVRWNIQAQKFDKIPEYMLAKTIAAFLNTSGGTLAVGVKDNAEIVGLKRDRFEDRDAILLHFDNLTRSFLSDRYSPLIRTSFVELEGNEVLRIDCRPASAPVFLKPPTGNDVEFFIRRQASSVKLRTDEALAYIQQRFGSFS
jgi:DNA-binding response OmpR family regulator